MLDQVTEGQYAREFSAQSFRPGYVRRRLRLSASPRAAFLKRKLDLVASMSAFYRKLGSDGAAVSAAIVRETADRARELISAAGGLLPEPVPGYAARILDGNILTGTDHRIAELRSTRSAALPGMSLAVYEPVSGLIRDLILEENAHTQERALLDQVAVEPGQLWIMDRNFCVRTFLFRILRTDAFFLVRWHASTMPFEPIEPLRSVGRCDTGEIFEQPIWVDDPECEGRRYRLRRIVLRLDKPTRDGDTEIVLITNLPKYRLGGVVLPGLPRTMGNRGAFPEVDRPAALRDPDPGIPPSGPVRLLHVGPAGNALAVLKGNLRAVHGDEMVNEVSTTPWSMMSPRSVNGVRRHPKDGPQEHTYSQYYCI